MIYVKSIHIDLLDVILFQKYSQILFEVKNNIFKNNLMRLKDLLKKE